MSLFQLGKHLLTDEKFPAPVVPPDLHLVRQAVVDADGRVECIYCRQPVPLPRASLIGSEGYACPACLANAQPVAPPIDDVRIKRGPVPLLIAIGVVGVLAAIIAVAASG